ncbi:putative F-box protein At4g21240 [Capsella rubella]|nr:putative F-box protein At4g21240 [Capsella rubella]
MSSWVTSFLGYDPTENTYKLLSLGYGTWNRDKYRKPQILTLGCQESWRVAENSPLHYPRDFVHFINGVVYYKTDLSPDCTKKFIMSFDVKSEQFKSIQMPGHVGSGSDKLISESIMSYQGKLAWVCNNLDFIKIWVLQDAEKQEWAYKDIIIPLPQRDLVKSGNLLISGTDAGEFIYIPINISFKDISAFYYDPVRNSIRSVKALEYDQFRRFYGSCNDHMYSLEPLPDHIESLVSLKDIMSSSPPAFA